MDDRKCSRSLQLNVNEGGSRLNNSSNRKDSISEFYKPIPEESLKTEGETFFNKKIKAAQNNTIMVQETFDGADEEMLGSDNKKLAAKREEVKFIKGDHQNGDAKIDIGAVNGKAFTGMTKEELMKYANDPFWVRLRWIFFIAFWAIWVAMLFGAILIIVDAPKCAAPEPLSWWKRGPLAKFLSLEVGPHDLVKAEELQATGVIYELAPELMYSVDDPQVKKRIEDIVAKYKGTDRNVILDVTANYVTNDSQMLKEAKADEKKRTAFFWKQRNVKPNDYLTIINGSDWYEVQEGSFVFSQFGDGRFDLNMSDSIVREKLNENLKLLIQLGVKGFRLKNTKLFLLSDKMQNEDVSAEPNEEHKQTKFETALGDVLHQYMIEIKNVSADAFLSIADVKAKTEEYQTSSGEFGIDMPTYKQFTQFSKESDGAKLRHELQRTINFIGNKTWLQWEWADASENDKRVTPSAFELFLSLLPGVPVITLDSNSSLIISKNAFEHINQWRSSPSYMHGNFTLYDSGAILSYSRIKSGNPGFFVVYNPTNETQTRDYTEFQLPEEMTIVALSENLNLTETYRVKTKALEVSALATVILTYVPLK